ncbi:hypothetical protein F4859DRAFT_392401 [Xylaria cf. heliscus]|nr:hypothetical protein F4859DRAFT_392401 [Xylaria cf. heliscus]
MPTPSSEPVTSFVARCLLAWLCPSLVAGTVLCPSYLSRPSIKAGVLPRLSPRDLSCLLFHFCQTTSSQNSCSLLRSKAFTIPHSVGI